MMQFAIFRDGRDEIEYKSCFGFAQTWVKIFMGGNFLRIGYNNETKKQPFVAYAQEEQENVNLNFFGSSILQTLGFVGCYKGTIVCVLGKDIQGIENRNILETVFKSYLLNNKKTTEMESEEKIPTTKKINTS